MTRTVEVLDLPPNPVLRLATEDTAILGHETPAGLLDLVIFPFFSCRSRLSPVPRFVTFSREPRTRRRSSRRHNFSRPPPLPKPAGMSRGGTARAQAARSSVGCCGRPNPCEHAWIGLGEGIIRSARHPSLLAESQRYCGKGILVSSRGFRPGCVGLWVSS